MDLSEPLHEENCFVVVPYLEVFGVVRGGRGMRTHDRVGEGAHFDPSLKQFLASYEFLYQRLVHDCVAANVRMPYAES